MSTTFVTIDGETGFWMHDTMLELWLRLLALHIAEPTPTETLARQVRDQWLLASRGWFTGCVPHNLEAIASQDEGSELIRSAVLTLVAVLNEAPAVLPANMLNLIGFSFLVVEDVETAKLIDVGAAFLDLLDRKIKAGASDTSLMPGTD